MEFRVRSLANGQDVFDGYRDSIWTLKQKIPFSHWDHLYWDGEQERMRNRQPYLFRR
jgi:hypothetical protein